jgi:uncharacterized membrane protein
MGESVPFRFVPSPALWRRAFVGVCVLWAVALPLASLEAAKTPASHEYLFAAAVYLIGSLVCHQLPARSFHLWATQMPVCARCTGIYAGAAVAAIVAAAWPRVDDGGTANARLVLAVSALPTAVTLIFEWTTGITPSNALRAVAGVPLGAAAAFLVVSACREAALRPPSRGLPRPRQPNAMR